MCIRPPRRGPRRGPKKGTKATTVVRKVGAVADFVALDKATTIKDLSNNANRVIGQVLHPMAVGIATGANALSGAVVARSSTLSC